MVLDPATMLVIDVVPCEDAHAQERSLVDQVLPGVEPGDLWIADRNFCTTRLLFGILAGGGSFLIRQHKSTLHWEEADGVGRGRPGRHRFGQRADDPGHRARAAGGVVELRRIRLALDNPTRGKDKELFLVTDVPADRGTAAAAGRGLPPPLGAGERVPDADRGLALRDRHAGLSEGGVVRLLRGVGGLQRAGGGPGGVAVGARGRGGGDQGVEPPHGRRGGLDLQGDDDRPCPPGSGSPTADSGCRRWRSSSARRPARRGWRSTPEPSRGPKKPQPRKASGRKNHHVSTARLLNKRNQQE